MCACLAVSGQVQRNEEEKGTVREKRRMNVADRSVPGTALRVQLPVPGLR